MFDFWLFLMLGVSGSAAPAHIGFRVLAYRHHRDRGWPFDAGAADGGFGYSWWLMRRGYAKYRDPGMGFFAFWAMLAGWISVLAMAASATLIAIRP